MLVFLQYEVVLGLVESGGERLEPVTRFLHRIEDLAKPVLGCTGCAENKGGKPNRLELHTRDSGPAGAFPLQR
jgi:hypothetical protein